MRALAAVVSLLTLGALAAPARADDDLGGSVIFARGSSLWKTDPRGKGETELAKLPAKVSVRALRSDAGGSVLLADLGGTWSWMPLDGSTKALADLPCADGPAQLAEDGLCVLCRARGKAGGSIIVNLGNGKVTPVDVPAVGARLAGIGVDRRLVWADANGVWSAPPRAPKQAKKVAPEAPLRGFLPSPDGGRAVGVYADEIYTDAHHKKPADLLMDFRLDGEGARRKAIKDGVPVEWSHDSAWVLVQDGASACLMHATGGEYKCWRGYTAASVSPDGKFALVLGNRDGSKRQTPAPAPKKGGKPDPKAKGKGKGKGKPDVKADAKKPDAKKPEPEPPAPPADGAEAGGDDSGETDGEEGPAPADVAVAPPSGPLALYRAALEGSPFTEAPALVTKIVDGAAVWVPAAKP